MQRVQVLAIRIVRKVLVSARACGKWLMLSVEEAREYSQLLHLSLHQSQLLELSLHQTQTATSLQREQGDCGGEEGVGTYREEGDAGLPAVLLLERLERTAQDAAQHVKHNLSQDGLDGPKVLVAMLFRMIDNGSYSAVSKLSKVLFDEAQRRRMQVPAMLYMAS